MQTAVFTKITDQDTDNSNIKIETNEPYIIVSQFIYLIFSFALINLIFILYIFLKQN